MSFHLSALEQARLVQSTRQGRSIVYAVCIQGLRSLIAFLTDTCCGGYPERCGDMSSLAVSPWETELSDSIFNVLFLCTQNSARSIMAEVLMNALPSGRFRAFSAGSEPIEAPRPQVIEQLRVHGHNVASLRSKSWHEFTGPDAPHFDFVITLCDTLIGQACPDFEDHPITAAWPLPDPAKFSGSAAERVTLLNELYGSLKRRIGIFDALRFASLDRMALKRRLQQIGGAVPAGR